MTYRGKTGEILQHQIQFEWRIVAFLSHSIDENDMYKSPMFQFLDSLWDLRMVPRGYASDGDWIGVYLRKQSDGRSKTVSCSLAIKSEISPGEFGKMWIKSETFKNGDSGKGWGQFLKRSELLEQRSTLLPSGVLTIRCCLMEGERKADSVIPLSTELTELKYLSMDLENLLASGANSDVTLHVQKQEFRAHRSILTARSEVLASMFECQLSESKTGTVDIVDCDPDSFADFLRYLYTGKLEGINSDKAFHLYVTADKYAVLDLKSRCVELMARDLSADNLCAVASLAQRHDDDQLFALVQDFFNVNLVSVLSEQSWDELVREDYNLSKRLLKEMALSKK